MAAGQRSAGNRDETRSGARSRSRGGNGGAARQQQRARPGGLHLRMQPAELGGAAARLEALGVTRHRVSVAAPGSALLHACFERAADRIAAPRLAFAVVGDLVAAAVARREGFALGPASRCLPDCVELRAAGNTGPTASPRRAAIERAGARLLAFCTLRSARLPARTAAAAVLAALATGLFARVGVDVAGIGHARLGISERAREEVGRDEGPIARRLGRRELAVLAERCDRPRVGPRRRPILSRPRDEVDLRR